MSETSQDQNGQGKIGVLLVNLGTPDAPEPGAVRRYLREFLSDRRVVDYPRVLWLPLLYGVILNVRPAATARNYAKVWRVETNESPLRYFTRRQAEMTAAAFDDQLFIDWAMRYGAPSVAERMEALCAAGCERLLVIPLYPQYSTTTTESVADAVSAALSAMRPRPAVRIAAPFYNAPVYIEGLAAIARARLAALDWEPERILVSFHGLPKRLVEAGDPYARHCAETAALLRHAAGWSEAFAPMTYQSRFGPEEWLGPSTEDTLKALAAEGVKRAAVITPGFVADCIETLEEIAIAGRETFIEAGGAQFDAIPCLNDSPQMEALLGDVIRREMAGWVD